MEFATLEAMFPGRSRIAVGHGVQSWMRQAGAAVASPLTLLREYTNALRSLLAGDTVSVEGRYVQLSDVRLEFVPERRPAILIGGTGPKTLRLAGEIADGVLVDSSYSTRTVHTALAHVADGRAAGGAGPFSTVMFVVCAPGTTPTNASPRKPSGWRCPRGSVRRRRRRRADRRGYGPVRRRRCGRHRLAAGGSPAGHGRVRGDRGPGALAQRVTATTCCGG